MRDELNDSLITASNLFVKQPTALFSSLSNIYSQHEKVLEEKIRKNITKGIPPTEDTTKELEEIKSLNSLIGLKVMTDPARQAEGLDEQTQASLDAINNSLAVYMRTDKNGKII